MPTRLSSDPKHWLLRAEEARIIAEMMDNIDAREAMLRAAIEYEILARRAELRLVQFLKSQAS